MYVILHEFDRIVVYADGSSISSLRHQPPLRLDELGQGDTWAFIAIGEVYDADNDSWMARATCHL